MPLVPPDGVPVPPSIPNERPTASDSLRQGVSAPSALPTPSDGVLLAVLESLADGVVVADIHGHVLLFNRAAERMLQVGALELEQSDWKASRGCFHEDEVTPCVGADLPLARALQGETLHEVQLLVRNARLPRGVWLSVNASPVLDASGAVRGGVAILRDVTSKRRERERAQVLSTAVEQTADCVMITNRDGVIEYVNPAVEAITGYGPADLIGARPSVLRSEVHTREFWAAMWATVLRGETFRGTIVNRKKSGELYYSQQTITPIRDDAGAISRIVSVGKDITELRNAALRDSMLQLARDVQQRLLPAPPPPTCGFDIAAGALMADKTGGDFYDFVPLADGRVGLVVGDVSGHAFDAALVMARTHAYFRSITRTTSDPGEIMARVNRSILDDVLENQFVTALVAFADRASGRLVFASAGHPTGYVLDPRGDVIAPLASTGVPLGLFPDAQYASASVRGLERGGLVVLLTDGLVEAEGQGDVQFGADRALEIVRQSVELPAAEIVRRLQSAVSDHTGHGNRSDDITVVVSRVL